VATRTVKTVYEILGRDNASAAINRTSTAFKGLQATAGNAFKTMAIGGGFMAAGGGLLNFMGSAVGGARELEYALAELKGVSQATTSQMEALTAQARQLGIETQFTPTQAVEGLTALAQQGFTAAQQLKSIRSVLYLAGASGGKVPLAEAAKLTAQTLKAFQLDAEDTEITIDQLVKTTTMSGLAIDELALALQNASAGAIAMGLGVGESMTALGLIKNIIPSAQMAGSAFQILTQRLSDPRVQGLMKKNLGVDIVDEATGKYRDFGNVLVELSSGMMDLTESQRGALIGEAFGARAKKGILAIMAQLEKGITTTTGEVLKGQAAWDYWQKNLDPKNVKGFAESLNDLKLDTLHGQLELVNGSFDTFMQELGKGLAMFQKGAIKAFLGVFNSLLEIFSGLPAPVKAAISAFITFGGVLLKVTGAFIVMKGVMSLLGISLGAIISSLGRILLFAGPLALLFGAIGIGVYGVARAMKKNIGGVGSSWGDLWSKVKLGWQGVIDVITTGGFSEAVMGELNKVENKGFKSIMVTIMRWIGNAKAFFKGIVAGFDAGLERLAGPLDRLKQTVGEVFGVWFDGAKQGTAATEEWAGRGRSFGDMLSRFSQALIMLVDNTIKFGDQLMTAMSAADVTIPDVIEGVKGLFTVLEKTFSLLVKIIESVDRLMDARTVFGTFGKDLGELTQREMLARVNLQFGNDARARLQKQLNDLNEAQQLGAPVFQGIEGKAKHRKMVEQAFQREVVMTAAGGANPKRIKDQERFVRENHEFMQQMLSELRKRKDKQKIEVALQLDRRELARQMVAVSDENEEEDFNVPTMPMSIPEGSQ